MIPFDDCINIGRITRKWGYENELIIRLGNNMPQGFSLPDFVFVLLDGKLIPFGIKSLHHDGDRKFIVAFHDTSDAMRERLVQKEIYIFRESMGEGEAVEAEEAMGDDILIGYLVVTTKDQNLGLVTGVMDRMMQPLLVTDCGGKEGLIPLTPEIIKSIDHDSRTILAELPDGLIDLL